MIDSVPSRSPAIPVLSAPPASSELSSANSADPASKVGVSTPDASVTQESFANTLQNRLRLNSLNKAVNTPVPAAAGKTIQLPLISPADLADHIAMVSDNSPNPATTSQINALVADALTTKAKTDSESPVAIAPALPDPAAFVPLALNTVNPAAQPTLPQSPGVSANASARDNTLRHDATAAGNHTKQGATDAALPTAILAATPENTDQAAANPDSKTSNGSFTDALRNAVAGSTNPGQAPPGPPTREVASPLASAQWASDVGNQLSWMVGKRESHAELVLNPPQLGRIEVSITLNGDQASANFVSANPEVRDALTGSLPRLREVLADAGVFLGQANVGAESFSQSGNDAEKGRKSPGDSISPGRDTLLGSNSRPISTGISQLNRGQGLIDLFA